MVGFRCKRCKEPFEPKKSELRCRPCLTKRAKNRLTKRKEAKENRDLRNSIESMMKSNGSKKRASNVNMLY